MVRLIEVTASVGRLIPEVVKPERKPRLTERLIWTAVALIIYLVMGYIDLFGVPTQTADPLRQMRVIIGGARGSLAELGIGPIVTGGLILQLLAGTGFISYDQSSPEDRELFAASNKAFALLFSVLMAGLYAFGGTYGSLDLTTKLVIFAQLLFAAIVLLMLDELLQKGWGIGSGISLFILAGVAREIMWSLFSPIPMSDSYADGVAIAFVQQVLAGKLTPAMLFVRSPDPSLPTVSGAVVTMLLLGIVVYLENVSIQVPVSSARARGFSGNYPIKLLFVSTLPIILAAAVFSNLTLVAYFVQGNSQIASIGFMNVTLGGIIGQVNATSGRALNGLVYYTSAPRNITETFADPVRSIIYMAIMIVFCVVFSILWVYTAGMDPRSIAQQLMDAGA
ncbi:MAG TPA: preprotein translocase subunit SecY, partial [Thermoproteota archaeon]|nr:preprotein translocase subunit SecY [Thermoproteota archaeon]